MAARSLTIVDVDASPVRKKRVDKPSAPRKKTISSRDIANLPSNAEITASLQTIKRSAPKKVSTKKTVRVTAPIVTSAETTLKIVRVLSTAPAPKKKLVKTKRSKVVRATVKSIPKKKAPVPTDDHTGHDHEPFSHYPAYGTKIKSSELRSIKRHPLGHLLLEGKLREAGFRGGISSDKKFLERYSTD